MSGWKQWNKQAATSSFLDKKPPESLVQQGLEGSTAVGKDEVGGSNPPSSSKKSCFLLKTGLFCYIFGIIRCGSRCGSSADPHRDPHAEMCGKGERGAERILLPLRPFFPFGDSHHLCHEAAHGLCGFVLLLTGGVGVGAESEPCIVVSQHTADSFYIHAVL